MINNTNILPSETYVGSVELAVKNINLMTDFYISHLGFKLLKQEANQYYLGAQNNSKELIILTERKDLKFPDRKSPGLFHIALLVPSRKELAKVFMHLNNSPVNIDGYSNHNVSEAIYLRDPEGNGIEIYADTPKESWRWKNGEVQMVTDPLDVDALISTLEYDKNIFEGLHQDSRVGHIHLKVSSIEKAKKFYNEIVGFNITQSDYPGALFFATGKYHHHIGTNVWISRNETPKNEDTLGLQKFSVVLPDLSSLAKLSLRLQEYDFPLIKNEPDSLLTNDLDGIKVEFKIEQK